MKELIYILAFLLSGVAFGQKYVDDLDEDFIKFREKLYSLEQFELSTYPIERTDNTIKLIDTNGVAEKFKLKYVFRETNPDGNPDGTGLIMRHNRSYARIHHSYTKFGTDFIVIIEEINISTSTVALIIN